MAAFVGQIVAFHQKIGRMGLGPSRFVLFGGGGGVLHVFDGPQPKFRFGAMRSGRRLTSSLQAGPFSVTYGWPVMGWNARPNMFRWPYVYTSRYHVGSLWYGLSGGVLPSVFIRRTLPIGLLLSCASAGFAFS